MRILLFGTGDYYHRYKKWFEGQDVLALLDNSLQKHHTVIDGWRVLPPEEGIRIVHDIIVVLSFHIGQMRRQLISLGEEPEKILHFYDLRQLPECRAVHRPLRYFLDAGGIAGCPTVARKILLLSNDLSLGGPAIALSHAASVLRANGYVVVLASMIDGPLREELIRDGIPVIIDENLQIATMQETEWVRSFSLIICNTLNFHVFLSERDTRIPVIWWLHDARFFYDGVNRGVIGRISLIGLTAVSVGPVPETAIREFLPALGCGRLLYGVADLASPESRKGHPVPCDQHEGMRFVTIGFLEMRKGQDILLQAVRSLPDHIRRRCTFYIVGHERTLFGEQLQEESREYDEVIFTGSVGRERIHELLETADMLICPSRQDPMPTVAAEAMVHAVPCIVSDATGTAAYIHDGGDGMIFPSGDAGALAGKIAWCVEHQDNIAVMGERARILYEEHFSMQVFGESLMGVVKGALGDAADEG